MSSTKNTAVSQILTNFQFTFLKESQTETAKKYEVNMNKKCLDLVTESITVSGPAVST